MQSAPANAIVERDAVADIRNSLVLQRCGTGGQRNTSQLWDTDGAAFLLNQGRCLEAAPAAPGFDGERLTISDPNGGPCQWKLASPPYAHAPGGNEVLAPHMIVGQPPNMTGHCDSAATCVEEALDVCRNQYVPARPGARCATAHFCLPLCHNTPLSRLSSSSCRSPWCTATSVFPDDVFYEIGAGAAGALPNYDWLTYYDKAPEKFQVITNGTHCATLRNTDDPYLVPTADCANDAVLVRQNGSWIQAGGAANLRNSWGCIGAVEPNPLVRASTAAQVLAGMPVRC